MQLGTASKMFTRVPCRYGEAPNTLTNPVVLGLPGALPVMNREAIERTVKVGLLLGCEIAGVCKWDRKNYFYPDSPKNYQISQYDQPICIGGEVEIELPGPSRNVMGEHRRVKLTRIHLEEDVGKLTHFSGDSLVDYNRAGTPLIEIVSEPDLHTSEEVVAYLNSLKQSLICAGVSDCDMEKGQLRCDANVSVRRKGSTELGTRTEMKNLNSISGVRGGVDYEIKRQIEVLSEGGVVVQQTRRWDADGGYTTALRDKEESHDYRYFPDPDLMPVRIEDAMKERLKAQLPELPFDRQRRFFEQYDLPYTVTAVLCPNPELGDYFEKAVEAYCQPKKIANWVANDLLRELAASSGDVDGAGLLSGCRVLPEHIASLVKLVEEGVISSQIAKEVFVEIFASGDSPQAIVEKRGLKQSTDEGEIKEICSGVIEANPKPVKEFKAGREAALNALKGQVMKATRGKANPRLVDKLLRELLEA